MRGHVIVGVMTISTDIDKLYDTDLTDAAWALIAPMLPAARPGGRQRKINIRAPWIVERSFAWLGRNRRLSKDYEYCVQSSETLIEIAPTRLMLNRLTQA